MDLAIKNTNIIFTESEKMEGEGGKEVRRINIVYFLSRNGEIEQPHLFQIHHFTRNGVFLRDVKTWITQLRGEGIAETFTWSYKRKYKQIGFVWQDLLLDKDLLTPISDNEYILKGTQIPSTTMYDISLYGEKDVTGRKVLPVLQSANKILSKQPTNPEISPETEKESHQFSVKPFIVTYKSIKVDNDADSLEIARHNMGYERYEDTCFFKLRFPSKNKNGKNEIDFDKPTMNSPTWSTPRYSLRSTRTNSSNSSNTFRNNVSHRVGNKKNVPTSKRSTLSSLVGLFIPQQIIN